MSRKWERMVRKNTRSLNKQRAKCGKSPLSDNGTTVFRGRSWMFASLMFAIGIVMLLTYPTGQADGLYWFTVISYFALGLLIYFVRRPYLRITRNQIATRKFTGEKMVEAPDIRDISIFPGYVVINFEGKRKSWVFSRFVHLYDINAMSKRLGEFAKQNQLPLFEQGQSARPL